MNGLIRESKNRTKSERKIDKLISNEDIEASLVKKIKISEEKSEISQLSTSQGFEKLKKCLANPNRIQKTVPVLLTFIKRYHNKIPFPEVYHCLNQIFSSDFSKSFPIPQLSDLLSTIEELYPAIPPAQLSFIRSCQEISETFNLIFTDDSLEFHKILKKAESSLLKFSDLPDLAALFSKSLQCLLPFVSKPWSRSAVVKFFENLYLRKSVFEENAREVIEKALDSRSGKGLCEDIRSIGQAGFCVADGKVTVLVADSQDSWACSQSGLKDKSGIF